MSKRKTTSKKKPSRKVVKIESEHGSVTVTRTDGKKGSRAKLG